MPQTSALQDRDPVPAFLSPPGRAVARSPKRVEGGAPLLALQLLQADASGAECLSQASTLPRRLLKPLMLNVAIFIVGRRGQLFRRLLVRRLEAFPSLLRQLLTGLFNRR